MKKYLLHIVLFFCIIQLADAQENGVVAFNIPARNSLKFNKQFINPTFSFVREQNKYINFNNKREWVQFDNAPQTYLFGYSGRFRENIGAGISLYQQNYGVLTTFGGVANFAYNAVLDRDSNLTFGVNLGFYKSGINTGNVITNFPYSSLDNFPSNSIITINPGINYGTGFFDFGASIKNLASYNLVTSRIIEDDPEQAIQAHILYTGYFNTRGFFDESRFSSLISSEFRKDQTVVSGMIMLLVPKGIWAQAGYNSLYALSAGVGLNISSQISIEYNYEKGVGGFSTFGSSHDFTLAYKFNNKYRYNYSGDDEEEALLIASKKKKKALAKRRKSTKTVTRKKPQAVISDEEKVEELEELGVEELKSEQEIQTKQLEESKIKALQEEQTRIAEAAQLKSEQDAQVKLVEDAKVKALQEEQARVAEVARLKLEQEAQLKLAEEAKVKALQEEQARVAEAARLKLEQESQLKLAEEAKVKALQEEQARVAEAARLKLEKEAQLKLAEEAKVKALQEEQTRIVEAAQLKAEQEAQVKLAEEAKVKGLQEEQARVAEAARLKLEQEAQLKLAEEAKVKALQEEQTRIVEAAQLKAEQEAQVKLAEEAKVKAFQEEQARVEEAERLKLEQEVQVKLAEEAKVKALQEEQTRVAEAARLKEEQETQLKLVEEARVKVLQEEQTRVAEAARLKEEQETQLKLVEEARVKALQEEQTRVAEVARLKLEQETQLKLAEEAKVKAQQEVQKRIKAEKESQIEEIVLDEVLIKFKKSTKESNNAQQVLFNKLNEKVVSKQQDLDNLKEENDLSEKGIVSAPKAFKSVSAENTEIESLKLKIDNSIEFGKVKISEIEALYKERLKKVKAKNDSVNIEYLKTIEKLKSEQLQAETIKRNLIASLNDIKLATDFERNRRIKRAAYDNEDDRYNKDRTALANIKKFTEPNETNLTKDDFDYGDPLSNIQIVKGINNTESGYYLVVAVHSDVNKRDDFLKKAVSAGQKDIDFFFDVNTSKYYIYYESFNNIGQAKNALDTDKGNKVFNGKMAMVKIEN